MTGDLTAKLRSRQGAYKVEYSGPDGQRGHIWLGYLESSQTIVVRNVIEDEGDGRIEIE